MRSDFLTRVPLFTVLEKSEIAQLLKETKTVKVAAGEFLFRRGDRGDALYIVENGIMDAVIDEGLPSERTLNTFFPGDFFGEMALLTREPRSASLRALIDSGLIKVSYEQFARLLINKPVMALHMCKVLSNYLSRTNERLSRRGARISTIIPIGNSVLADTLATQLLVSLEGQFGGPAVIVILGDSGFIQGEQHYSPDLGNILDYVSPLPSGGHYLRIGENVLKNIDDQAMVAIINSLRFKFSHILVWMSPSDASKRLTFLTRLDQTFLFVCHPFDYNDLRRHSSDLAKVLKANLRIAFIAPQGQTVPPMQPAVQPQIRLYVGPGSEFREGVERLARALAGMTIGLVLGSGTAQGLAHLGVMKAITRAGIPIDLIAGTSGGALYGSMVASGLSIDASVKAAVYHTRRNLIDKIDPAVPRRGLIRGFRIENMIRESIGDITFAELPIPLYPVAADLDTGEEVIIRNGPVYKGVRASISVPGIFEPYQLDGRLLIDGVVVNPLPVSVARSMGADLVIAVQVPAPGQVVMGAEAPVGRRQKTSYNIISTIVRSHHFVGDKLADKAASEADVLIKPEVSHYGWREYRAATDIIEAGFRAGCEAIKQISGLIRSVAHN